MFITSARHFEAVGNVITYLSDIFRISSTSEYLPPLEQQKGWHHLGKEIITS